jgi:putative endonuclease
MARQARRDMVGFHYVYILESECGCHFYVGLTDDLARRVAKHNAGGVPHTSKFRPWKLKTAIAFRDREKGANFESYLKTASGRAFAKKRL